MNRRAIGVFDSGIGGLTVFAAIRRRLPCERIFYLGDTARVPYGAKSPKTIQRYSMQIADFLLGLGIKLMVVACNTASAWALEQLCAHSPVPVIDVIEPGCRKAVEASRGGSIGVIGTHATIRSEAYPAGIRKLAPSARVTARACPLFVPLVEEGWLETRVTALVAEEYLRPLVESGIDCLVLGCTHYPLLQPVISRYMGRGVELISSSEAVAEAVERDLRARGLLGEGQPEPDRIFLTDHSPAFQRAMRLFLDGEPGEVELVDIQTIREECSQ